MSEPASDELDGETAADGEEGKGDAAAAFTYFELIPDNRACSLDSPSDCGRGFFVSRVNRTTTQCGRGLPQSQCKVDAIDWTGTAMPASVAQSYEDTLKAGGELLVRAEIVPAPNDAGASLAVTEIWVGNTTDAVDGVFTRVSDNGLRCIKAPCPSLTEQKLNSNLSSMMSSLDFEPADADQAAINVARNQLYGSDGLVVVGFRYYDSFGGKGRTANKFYTRAPVPLRGL